MRSSPRSRGVSSLPSRYQACHRLAESIDETVTKRDSSIATCRWAKSVTTRTSASSKGSEGPLRLCKRRRPCACLMSKALRSEPPVPKCSSS